MRAVNPNCGLQGIFIHLKEQQQNTAVSLINFHHTLNCGIDLKPIPDWWKGKTIINLESVCPERVR